MMKNIEIRNKIAEKRLRYYEVAAALGITNSTFSNWLRFELSAEKRERVLQAIESIKCNDKNCKLSYCDRDCEHYQRIVDKLAKYESLEEQGLLLRLPISVGSPIWDNDFGSPYRYEVTGFSYGDINEDDYDYDPDEELPTDELIVHYKNYNVGITGKFPISEIGKTVFLTQYEVEEKLRELEGK